MKSVDAPPKKCNPGYPPTLGYTGHGKGCPAWFSAVICSVKEYGTIRYAGEEFKDNLYNVICWDGTHEVVPEAVLMANRRDTTFGDSAGRVVPNSGLVGIEGRNIYTSYTPCHKL